MIDRLKLSQFKAFKDLELELGRITLLSGLNSSGKSSVLQALAMLRQSSDEGMASGGVDEWLLNGPLAQLGTARDVYHEFANEPTLGLALRDVSGEWSGWEAAYEDRDADVLTATSKGGVQQGGAVDAFLKGPFQYLRADRISPEVVYPRSHQQVVRRRSLGSRGEFTVHYLSQFRDEPVQNEAVIDERQGPSLLSQVTQWMGLIAPGVRVEPEAVEDTDFVRVRFGFGAAAGLSGSQSYRPTHVGFGLTYTLPIIVAALAVPPGGTLLLENPEAHVHPRGQAELGRLLSLTAKGGVQVVVESHSDHLLNGIRLAVKRGEIAPDDVWLHFFARKSASEVVKESPIVDRTGRLSRWPDGFFDQWDRDLDVLLD